MAVLYLGVGDKAKKISGMYIGVEGQPKKIIKAYIGVDNKAKLFYNKYEIKAPTLKFLSKYTYNNLDGIKFFFNNTTVGPVRVDTEETNEIIYYYTSLDGFTEFITSSGKIYLNKNSSHFLNDQPQFYDKGSLVETNYEKYFLFNKVEDFSKGLNGSGYGTIYGNPANFNFSNMINLSEAFRDHAKLVGYAQTGPKVINMRLAYEGCTNITKAVCGDNVKDLSFCYRNCPNLTKTSIKFYGTNIESCFNNAKIYGNINLYNSSVNFANICYYKRGASQLNIYIPSSLKLASYYKKPSSRITSYQKIDEYNYLLIGENNVYISNIL